ncbi:MAG: metallophosphoesterase [Bacteroidales bacterium]|nr:metallophosphoesterase [Bacteroidales bacterium]
MIRRSILLFSAVLLSVCVASAQNSRHLTVLHVNDTHSHIDPERGGESRGHGGVIERAAIVDSVRKADGKRNVLLLHAGDFSQGTSYFTLLKGDVEISLLNAMKYDCIALGNHEFDNGVDELGRRLGNLKMPVVCANYDFSRCALGKYVKPYVIIRRAGVRIGIIGLLTDVSTVVAHDIAEQFKYIDPAESVNRYVAEIKDKCDYIIVLSHIGFDEDCDLVGKVSGVDLVIGGHSHTDLDGLPMVKDMTGKDIPVVQDWCWGLEVGKLDISLK